MVDNMAANEETLSIDTVKKTLWDSLVALGENISGETLSALMEIIEGGGHVSNDPLEVHATISKNEQDKTVVTMDKTAVEFFEAAEAGRYVKAIAEDIPVGEGITADFTFIESINIIKSEAAGQNAYTVKAHLDITDDTLYIGDNLAGSDIVVLTEITE